MSKYKILIVEDELLVAADIEESLEILGYKVIGSVATGKDAIQKVSEELPDIILMDIMLKGNMTGIEAAREINKKHDVPIVYLTANADLPTIEKAKMSLPYGYIIKPFTEQDLQTNIEIAKFKFDNDIRYKIESDQYSRFFTNDNPENQDFFVEAENGLEKIDPQKIYYLEEDGEHTIIYTTDEDLKTRKHLDQLEASLPPENFVRVSKNYIVNLEKIYLLKFPEMIIADKMTVIIVDEDKKALLESKL